MISNLDTHLHLSVEPEWTVAEVTEKIQDEHSVSFPDVGPVTCMSVRVLAGLVNPDKAFRVSPTARMTGVSHNLPACLPACMMACLMGTSGKDVLRQQTLVCPADVLPGGVGYLRAELEPQGTVGGCLCTHFLSEMLDGFCRRLNQHAPDPLCRAKQRAQRPSVRRRPPRQGGRARPQASQL